jgi:hypothetical protein
VALPRQGETTLLHACETVCQLPDTRTLCSSSGHLEMLTARPCPPAWHDGDVPTIHVELFDAATSTLIGEADLPVDQLPESFATSTTLHLGGADWHVEHAEPMTRAEYVKTAHLVIRMRKIEYVDPQQMLFSLPTIENALPPVRPGTHDGAAALQEDDWRQVELVTRTFTAALTDELEAIRAIYTNEIGRAHV